MRRNRKTKKWLGKTFPDHCRIDLAKNDNEEEELHTFLHELLHAIAATMGWKSFYDDEFKTDAVAGLLLQFLITQTD